MPINYSYNFEGNKHHIFGFGFGFFVVVRGRTQGLGLQTSAPPLSNLFSPRPHYV
jgi:hypothetical protein